MKRWILILISMLAAPLAAPAQGREEAAVRDFHEFYRQGLERHGIVGSSFLLLRDGEIIDRQYYGLADREGNRKVDEQTIYHWASITKTLTGVAILQLRDRGRLSLDDPIIKYLPELREVHNPYGEMGEITLRHLLSHSAGFRDATWPWGGDRPWHPHEPARWSQLVAMMPYTEILFKPGTRFSYSNPGIIFLGRVIEILSGDDYEVYLDKNIFKPLEMYRSYFDATPYHLLPHRSHSYYRRDGRLEAARFDVDTGITVSNGGLNAPITDLARYVNFLLGDRQKAALYDVVLKRSSLEEMWRPHVALPAPASIDAGRDRRDAMGLTFFIEDNYGQHFIGHSGSQNGFVTHFYLRPDARAAYIIAFNTHAFPDQQGRGPNTRQLDREIKDYLFERVFPRFSRE
jgi:CubicO group peptidase (beta-lactamase class C family)